MKRGVRKQSVGEEERNVRERVEHATVRGWKVEVNVTEKVKHSKAKGRESEVRVRRER